MKAPKYSVVIPVYNRPDELDELLSSLVQQTFSDFEVIVVEDGSSIKSQSVVEKYRTKLTIDYILKTNTGPGPSRNAGFQKARGDYFVVFDSDCILPTTYFEAVEGFIRSTNVDAWGGPDRGHENFTFLQRAMAHTMSSFFTTGGIRGGAKMVGNYQPRSFNMGISRSAFQLTGGFKFDRFAEDIELSIRMRQLGLSIVFIPDAYVFHKRRATLIQFYQQVFNFGKGRARIGALHAGEVKWVHWFPTFFLLGLFSLGLLFLFNSPAALVVGVGYLAYVCLVMLDGLKRTKSTKVTLLSVPALFVQLTGYGIGFFAEKLKLLRSKR
ncbi:MAG: glycosyltransferase [Flammeovirgaceae bacterium]|jgi:glycosyltransferase involved in cell wall biosynthesis|nr:glycosyltransferase [Flammeovirgaceae bacterium]